MNSVYLQSLVETTKAIQSAFMRNNTDQIPGLVNEYRQLLIEVIQADGIWAINDKHVSLHDVVSRILSVKTSDGYEFIDDQTPQAYLKCLINNMPISLDNATKLVRYKNCPPSALVDKISKTNFKYTDYVELTKFILRMVSANHKDADKFVCDVLTNKIEFDSKTRGEHFRELIMSICNIDKFSPELVSILRSKEGSFIDYLTSNPSAIKYHYSTRVALKLHEAGCVKFSNWLVKDVDMMVYGTKEEVLKLAMTGIRVGSGFIKDALNDKDCVNDRVFLYMTHLVSPENRICSAIENDRSEIMSQTWFKCLGMALSEADKAGLSYDRDSVVDLISGLSRAVENKILLKGSVLASGIKGELLVRAPELSQYSGELLEGDLGL